MKMIIFDGHDGSGKTTWSKKTVAYLINKGFRSAYVKPFNNSLGDFIAWLYFKGDYELLNKVALKAVAMEKEKYEGYDFLVFDRQWLTVFTIIPESLQADWEIENKTIVCWVDEKTTIQRLKLSDTDDLAKYDHRKFCHLYKSLAKKYRLLLLDTTEYANAQITDTDIEEVLKGLKIECGEMRLEEPKSNRVITEGKSKKIFEFDKNHVIVELKPSLTSFTYNKEDNVEGTDIIRLDFFEVVSKYLALNNVKTAFVRRLSHNTFLSKYLTDVPPIEIIVKNFAIGSTIRNYPGLFAEFQKLEPPVIKFDYRTEPEDIPIAEDYIDRKGYDVQKFKALALELNRLLICLFAPYVLIDICFIFGVDDTGDLVVISEISPDCMRIKDKNDVSFDKDIFRNSADYSLLKERWKQISNDISINLKNWVTS